jgi:uncharacterized protein (TIGR03066 family)
LVYARSRQLRELNMIRHTAVVLGLVSVFGLVAIARADDKKTDDYPKLIIAKWEITKAGGQAQVGTVIDFAKDKSFAMDLKINDMTEKVKGTFSLEKDKLTLNFKFNGMDQEEVLTIKKLAEDAMELEDKAGGVDVLKKKK